MKWQPAFLYKIRQVIILTISWIIINLVIEINNSINYDPETREYFFYFALGNTPLQHFLITAIGPLVGGLLGGSFIIFYQRERLKGKSYAQKLLIHSFFYIVFVSFCIVMVAIIGALNSKPGDSFMQSFKADVFSLRVGRLLLTWYFIVIISIFFLDTSERFGAGNLRRLLLGKYYSAGKEERIFMFLDLKGSTTIAEQIGDEKYFEMLQFFYQVANETIINFHGEIYQYIGDEIVVSWNKRSGLENANCLRCFFSLKEVIEKDAQNFTTRFGVVPSFKAGIHAGIVSTGEIGTIKKDIVYSGDVLNTTARIVALCNQYNEILIVSSVMHDDLNKAPGVAFRYLDSPILRGKSVKLDLFAVKKN